MSQTIYDVPVKSIDGAPLTLERFKRKLLPVVNVVSKRGLTPRYESLEKLRGDERAEGLEVLGFPADNFKGQESGSDAEILAFYNTTYDVKFPLFSKISVVGTD
ncbi:MULTISPECIES: hypothetical protein [unclassified Caballeronia]|uniref:hypothetical protein n=1 Tax=unclassified Caballeronia TaxID=2646786 RepID=UPI003ED08424